MWEAIKIIFLAKEQVHDHWYTPLDDFQFSTAEFYQMVEQELAKRAVPKLEMSREQYHEGGMLSDKREYLRLKRERLVFDICAAPFGTSYFFSGRFLELPLIIKPFELFVFLIGLAMLFGITQKLFDFWWGLIAFFALIIFTVWILRNAIALGLKDLDAVLLKIPVVSPIYEIFFRKETYYREDTRLMYLTTVNAVVKSLVEKITGAKGVTLLQSYERAPILGDLYKPKTKRLPSENQSLERAA
jgi:hypothetical protein